MKNTFAKLIFGMITVLASGSASATSTPPDCSGGGGGNPACTTWNLTSGVKTGVAYSGTDANGHSGTVYDSASVVAGGHTLSMRAYASTDSNGAAAFTKAYIGTYGGGIGVSNCYDGSSGCNELTSPDHAIDSNGKHDFLLLEFDSVVSAQAFQIGWSDTDSDVELWTGSASAAAGLDLTGACVSGCVKTLTSLGFSAGTNHEGVAVDTNTAINPLSNSRYLLVSGQLGESNDYFKFKSVTACLPLPVPGTVALFGVALLGMLGLRRTRKLF
ncbi:MAG: hypothetical protein EPO06_09515 [Burkholderiaceae bacterium]|nr:MAG: hypothetical protein EPO06_09515 [Burkholderiaceae bacterium]